MEPQFKTSFIPKAPIATATTAGRIPGRSSGPSFFSLLSIALFLVAIVAGGLVFVWKMSLEKQIKGQIASLQKAADSFDRSFIDEATRLNDRIVAANQLLDNHIAPSEIFSLFEEKTLQTVAFKTFTFDDTIDGKVEVKATGEGDSFRSIVLQSDEFGKSKVMKDVLFTDLQPTEDENVTFSFEATLDPQYILYRKSLVPVSNGNASTTVENVEDERPAVEQVPAEDDLGVFGNDNQQ